MTAKTERRQSDNDGNQRLCVYLAPDVATRLRLWAAIEGRPLSKVLTALLSEALPTRDQLLSGGSDERAS